MKTENNPLIEDSQAIIDEIMTGVNSGFQNYELIQNRIKAIEFIINQSQKNDVMFLVEKEHDIHQVFKSKTITFGDREGTVQATSNKLTFNLEVLLPELCISYLALLMFSLMKSEMIAFQHAVSETVQCYRQVQLHQFQKLEAVLTACEIYNDKSDHRHYVINVSG